MLQSFRQELAKSLVDEARTTEESYLFVNIITGESLACLLSL